MSILLAAVLIAIQQPATAQPPTAQPARRAAAGPATLEVRVTDRSGTPLEGAQVVGEGPSSRDGVTTATGTVVLRNLSAGTYRLRATHAEFFGLEKEVAIRPGTPGSVDFALSAAPATAAPAAVPSPAPPPIAPPPAIPEVAPGEPRILSVLDVAERSLGGRDPVRTVPIGCSGLSSAQLIVVREARQTPPRPDVDEMLYVVAGEAMLNLAGKDQAIASGWFSVVPRGMAHVVTRRGRNPVVLLSIVEGQPCSGAATR